MSRKYSLYEVVAILSYRLYSPVLQTYWKIFKPYTFGTRLLIYHPQKEGYVLLIRHTYGDTETWNMPGGGFKPKKENQKEAARREAFEEVGIRVGEITLLTEYKSEREAKHDTVYIYTGTALETNIILESEIAEARWFPLSEINQLKPAHALKVLLEELAIKKVLNASKEEVI